MSSPVNTPSLSNSDTASIAVNGAGTGTWQIVAGENAVCVNARWCEMHGITCQSASMTLPLTMWWIRVHSDDLDDLKASINALLKCEIDILDVDYRVRHHDGQWNRILTRGSAVSWGTNKQALMFAGIDINIGTLGRQTLDEQELQLKANKLDFVMESSEQGIWHIDYENDVLSENNTWRTMRGYSADSSYCVNGAQWKKDIHPQDYDRVAPDRALSQGATSDIMDSIYRQRHSDGHWIWIWTRGKIIEKNQDGEPLQIIGTDTNITAIKEAELRYERLSNTLDLAIQAADIGVWEWPVIAKGGFWDKRTRDMFGLKSNESFVPDKQFKDCVHDDDRERLNAELESYTTANKDLAVDYRINHPDRGLRHIKARGKFENINDDDPRYVGIVWDVTQTIEREQELENAKNLLNEVLEQMDQGLVMFRGPTLLQANRIIANQNFYDLLEFPDEFASGDLNFLEYVEHLFKHNYYDPNPDVSAKEFLNGLSETEAAVCQLVTPSGRTLRSIGSSIGGHSRIVTFTDITDIVEAEKERSELNDRLSHSERLRSVGELTGGIAHDFNNLLAVIAGSAELLSMRISEEDKLVNAISSAAHRGAELTQGLLAFSSKQALRPTTIKMSTLINNVTVMLERTLGDEIILEISTPDDLWNCKADAGQLENALINLALNARDAMQSGGTLTIELCNATIAFPDEDQFLEIAAGDYVRITVNDTGTGMSQAILSKAIDPFFTTKTLGDGTGLGLSMVFGFVKQSQGSLNLYSTPGKGTTAEIYLPRSTESIKTPVRHSINLDHLSIGNGQTIMLVEDDRSVQQMITESLQLLGYTVLTLSDTKQAMSILENNVDSIDLMLTDIMLPGGSNGFKLGDVAKRLKPAINVIYMSGYAEDVFPLNEKYDEKLPEVLQKPFRIDDLAQRIAACFA